jgi:acetylornithine deacetylase/succinyl-diaminopimelate desuccinylase-like protein
MTSWDVLLQRLAETPRENGTPALHQTASWLHETLAASGLATESLGFTSHPYVLRLAGVVALVAAALYLRAVLAGRAWTALGVALVAPAVLLANLEWYVPVFGWVGAERAHHVRVVVPPSGEPEQRLILAAHYDTKTDLLDHSQRRLVQALAGPVLGSMGVAAALLAALPRRRFARRLARGAGWLALLWAIAFFLAISAGVFARARSPGALDDGGACAALVRLAEGLAGAPPLARTELEILLLAAEEVGVRGSWLYAAERFAEPPPVPTFVVNLEGIGASMALGVMGAERFSLRAFPPDPGLVDLLDDVLREREGRELQLERRGAATDARSFLAHGIPALTLFSREPGVPEARGLHSSADSRERLDPEALEASVAYLEAVLRAADSEPLR